MCLVVKNEKIQFLSQVLESHADSVFERGLSSMFRDQKREPI